VSDFPVYSNVARYRLTTEGMFLEFLRYVPKLGLVERAPTTPEEITALVDSLPVVARVEIPWVVAKALHEYLATTFPLMAHLRKTGEPGEAAPSTGPGGKLQA